MLHVAHQQIKRVLRMRLDVLQLGKLDANSVPVELDVVPILDLVKAVLGSILMLSFTKMSPHRFRVGPSLALDR